MSKKIILLALFLVTVVSGVVYAEEEITLSTFYPAPYGDYDELAANKMVVGPTYAIPANDGDLVVEGYVGIGTTTPGAPLDLAVTSETAIEFDNGHSIITVHDGYGNFNIKSGVNDDNIIIANTGGSHIRLDHDGYIYLGIDESTAVGGTFSAGTSLALNNGGVSIIGTLSKTAGTFLIDHPLDPKNKILRHSFVESPEPVLIYKGRSRLVDSKAVVSLPEYFDALNHPQGREVNLTCVGGWSPLYLASEISENSFMVKTTSQGDPQQEFSWVVYGVRNDAYIQKNPIIVEEEKGVGNEFSKGEYISRGI